MKSAGMRQQHEPKVIHNFSWETLREEFSFETESRWEHSREWILDNSFVNM
jgi:hypothetical protein